MASLRRSRTTPNDATISKFLYTILKQLDLKSIDWQEVADQMEITNGHAARMRYSRFKQQIEGVPSAPRKARLAVPRQKRAKPDNKPPTEVEKPELDEQALSKEEPGIKAEREEIGEPMQVVEETIKPELIVKDEPLIKAEPEGEEGTVWLASSSMDVGEMDQMSLQPAIGEEGIMKQEPVVKMEPVWQG